MGEDNKDQYGWGHRDDDEFGLGDTKPGTTGDSEGTFHDRATSDNNVIINGKVENYETHKRKQQAETESVNPHPGQESGTNREQTQESDEVTGQFAELDGEVIEVEVERISGSGNPLALHRGMHVHVPNGEPGESYEVELEAKSGYFFGKIQVKE